MKDVALLILGAIIGWCSQWLFYRYQKRDEQRQGPLISVSKVTREKLLMMDIRNLGSDALSDMEVEISWLQNGIQEQRTIKNFFAPEQNPYIGSPIHIELMESGGHINAADIPSQTDDGIIDVRITGLGVKSMRLYSLVTQITVTLSRPQQL